MTIGDWTERFRGTENLPRDVRDRLLESARTVRHKAGKLVFGPDSIPDNLLFLVSGTIRVSQTSDNGRDIVLYRKRRITPKGSRKPTSLLWSCRAWPLIGLLRKSLAFGHLSSPLIRAA